MRKKHYIILFAILFLTVAVPAFAQSVKDTGLFISFRDNSFNGVMLQITRAILGLIGVVSMVYLLWGGYLYVVSGMNTELAERGKKTIRSAITGLIIAILSYIIVTVVVNSLFKL